MVGPRPILSLCWWMKLEILARENTPADVLCCEDMTTRIWKLLGYFLHERIWLFHPIDEIAHRFVRCASQGRERRERKNEMLGKKKLKGGTAVGLKVGKDVLSKYMRKDHSLLQMQNS